MTMTQVMYLWPSLIKNTAHLGGFLMYVTILLQYIFIQTFPVECRIRGKIRKRIQGMLVLLDF